MNLEHAIRTVKDFLERFQGVNIHETPLALRVLARHNLAEALAGYASPWRSEKLAFVGFDGKTIRSWNTFVQQAIDRTPPSLVDQSLLQALLQVTRSSLVKG